MRKQALLMAALLLGAGSAVFGQDMTPATPAPPKPGPVEAAQKAIRVNLSNTVLDFIRDTKQIDVDASWEWLPATEMFRDARQAGVKVESREFSVSNEKLGDAGARTPHWSEDVRDAEIAQWLVEALTAQTVPEADSKKALSQFTQNNADTQFGQAWYPPTNVPILQWIKDPNLGGGERLRDVIAGRISPTQYDSLTREQALLTALLGSQGVRYTIQIRSKDGTKVIEPINAKGAPYSGENVIWHIRLLRFPIPQPGTNGAAAARRFFYRFAVSAEIKGVRFFLKGVDDDEAQMRLDMDFKRDDLSLLGVFEKKLTSNQAKVTLASAAKDIPENQTPSYDSASLSFVVKFAATQAARATKGFLGGTRNTSIVSGSLWANGKLDNLIGVDTEIAKLGPKSPGSSRGFGRDLTAGAVFGVVPSSKNAFYVGPSIRSSIFTLSAGVRIGEEGKENDLQSRFAALFSIDLSRATGGKRDRVKFDYSNTLIAGTDRILASDTISETRGLVLWNFTTAPNATLPPADRKRQIRLVQTRDADNNEITDANRKVVLLFNLGQFEDKFQRLQYIPRGTYQVEAIPDTYTLKAASEDDFGLSGRLGSIIVSGAPVDQQHFQLQLNRRKDERVDLSFKLDFEVGAEPLDEDLDKEFRFELVRDAQGNLLADRNARPVLRLTLRQFVEQQVVKQKLPPGQYQLYSPASSYKIRDLAPFTPIKVDAAKTFEWKVLRKAP